MANLKDYSTSSLRVYKAEQCTATAARSRANMTKLLSFPTRELQSTMRKLLSFPTQEERQACWELCRLQNNIGFWVVWLPTAWSIAMIYHAQPQIAAKDALMRAAVYIPFCFGIKSLIMTIDDLLDHDVDELVERTKNRPIPRGAISLPRAWLFFVLQVILGVSLAVTFLPPQSLHVSMLVWPLYIIYPTCKRWMYLAPIPLGMMFKIGIFMGWRDLSVDGSSSWGVLVPLYIGACLWTITYETVYQHQDKVDDAMVGIKSPALLLRGATIPICAVSAVSFLGLLTYSGTLNGHGLAFYAGVAVAAMLLLYQLFATDVDRPEDCKLMFLGTPRVGQVILIGLIVDAVLHRVENAIPL